MGISTSNPPGKEVCAGDSGNTRTTLRAKQSRLIGDSFVPLDTRLVARILTRYPANATAWFFPFPWCRSRSFLDYFLENQFARRDCFLASPFLRLFVLSISRSFHFLAGDSGRGSETDFSPAPFVNLPNLYYPNINL